MSPAHATLPVPNAQALLGRTVLHSNPTPRNRLESFRRKRRIMGFFPDVRKGDEVHIVPDDDDTDPLPEEDYSKAPDAGSIEFDEDIMAHEWSPIPEPPMMLELQSPIIKIDYFELYPQHRNKVQPILEHPRFG